jgi:hypothetical protein
MQRTFHLKSAGYHAVADKIAKELERMDFDWIDI